MFLYLQKVNHTSHLGIDEDSVSLGLQATQQDIQGMKLATFCNETFFI